MAVQDFARTCVGEIADGIFRISTPVASIAGGDITYNQYLLVDDEPYSFTPGRGACFLRFQDGDGPRPGAGAPALDRFLALRG